MNNVISRVLSKDEFHKSDVQLKGYEFPNKELDCVVVVDEKVFNKHMGISTYVTAEDGSKYILTVWKDKRPGGERNYMPYQSDLDISKVPLGTKLKVKVVKSSKSDLFHWLSAEFV